MYAVFFKYEVQHLEYVGIIVIEVHVIIFVVIFYKTKPLMNAYVMIGWTCFYYINQHLLPEAVGHEKQKLFHNLSYRMKIHLRSYMYQIFAEYDKLQCVYGV